MCLKPDDPMPARDGGTAVKFLEHISSSKLSIQNRFGARQPDHENQDKHEKQIHFQWSRFPKFFETDGGLHVARFSGDAGHQRRGIGISGGANVGYQRASPGSERGRWNFRLHNHFEQLGQFNRPGGNFLVQLGPRRGFSAEQSADIECAHRLGRDGHTPWHQRWIRNPVYHVHRADLSRVLIGLRIQQQRHTRGDCWRLSVLFRHACGNLLRLQRSAVRGRQRAICGGVRPGTRCERLVRHQRNRSSDWRIAQAKPTASGGSTAGVNSACWSRVEATRASLRPEFRFRQGGTAAPPCRADWQSAMSRIGNPRYSQFPIGLRFMSPGQRGATSRDKRKPLGPLFPPALRAGTMSLSLPGESEISCGLNRQASTEVPR